jgi:hypothetical protein
MDRSATVTYEPVDHSAAEQTVAAGVFVFDEGLASNPIPKLLLRLPFNIPDVGDFVVESAVVVFSGSASLAVRRASEPADTLFLAGWGWQAGVDPYFGVRLPATGTIGVYLRSSSPAAR